MNYCSITDAWGVTFDNSIEHKLVQHNTIEHFTDSPDKKKANASINSHPIYTQQELCDKIFMHISNCKYCQNKISYYYKYNIIDELKRIINTNKDIIVLILVFIFVILLINICSNL